MVVPLILLEQQALFYSSFCIFCHSVDQARCYQSLHPLRLVLFPFCRKPSLVACSLRLLTLSPWQLTPLRGMELEARLKSSPQLEQVRGSFLRVILKKNIASVCLPGILVLSLRLWTDDYIPFLENHAAGAVSVNRVPHRVMFSPVLSFFFNH